MALRKSQLYSSLWKSCDELRGGIPGRDIDALEDYWPVFEETQCSAARAVDRSLIVRNWLFGWYIVEFEGGGLSRRELYGKELIAHLSNRLTEVGIKGCSRTNLRKFRQFYQAFKDIRQTLSAHSGQPQKIQQPLAVESFAPDTFAAAESMTELAACFTLGWSHYAALVTIDNTEARRFYEIEATENDLEIAIIDRLQQLLTGRIRLV